MPPRGFKKKKTQKLKSRQSQRPKFNQATVEDASDMSANGEDEIRSEVNQVRKVSKNHRTRLLDVFRIVENAARALTILGGREEIGSLLQENGIVEDEAIENLRKHCITISKLLPESKSARRFSPNQPSTIALYDQSFVYRASSSLLYLLKPVEVFKGNINFNRKKVFGFVRLENSKDPAMCAMPGWTVCADEHPKLLDPILWTTVVKDFVNFHNHAFKVAPFDKHHGREAGDTYAAHVEPRLMLWFAIDILQKQTGKVSHPSKQRGDLWMLKDLVRKTIEAEIVLSRAPCDQCLIFQEFMERYTPIKFSFLVCKNLGEVKFVKDKHNQVSLPLFVEESAESSKEESVLDSDSEPEPEPIRRPKAQMMTTSAIPKQRSNLAVVIRQKSTPRVARRVSPAAAETVEPTPSEVSVSTMIAPNSGSRVCITTHLRQYYNTPPQTGERRRRRRDYVGSSDEEEWSPPARPRSKPREENMTTMKAARSGVRTPDSGLFGKDALERARNIKKKRGTQDQMDELSSPISAKKARRGRN